MAKGTNNNKKSTEKKLNKNNNSKLNKIQNKSKKDFKKKVKRKSYADDSKINLNVDLKTAIWVCVVVLIVLVVFYFIAVKATGSSVKSKDETKQVEFQYDEILVGRSFDMGENYLVVYYDKSDTENEESNNLTSSISNFKTNHKNTNIYSCDLGNALNKQFVTTNEPNTNPFSAEDLLLNGPTVIKFSHGKVELYKYGFAEVQTYLDSYSE